MFELLVLAALLETCTCINNAYLPLPTKMDVTNPPLETYSFGSSTASFGSIGYAASFGSETFEGPTVTAEFVSSSHSVLSKEIYPDVQDKEAKLLYYVNHNIGDGNYNFEFLTGNKIHRLEKGHKKFINNEPNLIVQGFYSYVSPEGQVITVHYIADENGYRAHTSTNPGNSAIIFKK